MARALRVRPPAAETLLGTENFARILGVHPRTIQRRRIGGNRLAPLMAERERKLRRICSDLLEIYEPANAMRWLESEVPALGFRRPLDVMTEDGGLEQVLETVGRMAWGIPS